VDQSIDDEMHEMSMGYGIRLFFLYFDWRILSTKEHYTRISRGDESMGLNHSGVGYLLLFFTANII
jgi:hypothetical protein